MPAFLKVVTKPSLSSFISVEPANKQCAHSWGESGSLPDKNCRIGSDRR